MTTMTTTTTTELVLDAMVDAWADWARSSTFPFAHTSTRGYCINATRTGIEALRAFDVKAKPASVTLLVFNAAADQLFRAQVPLTEWPAHAWSIGLGMDDGNESGAWNGHLLIDGGDFTLDLSSEVLHRPGLIAIDRPLVLPRLPEVGDRQVWTTTNLVMIVERAPQNNAWRRSSGWKNRRPDVERELVARTRARLG